MKKILLALRIFCNHRLYAVVDTLGLALSLACVIAIMIGSMGLFSLSLYDVQ